MSRIFSDFFDIFKYNSTQELKVVFCLNLVICKHSGAFNISWRKYYKFSVYAILCDYVCLIQLYFCDIIKIGRL